MNANTIIDESWFNYCPPYEDWIIADQRRNFVYAPIPKCSNTAIKYALCEGRLRGDELHVRSAFPRLADVPQSQRTEFIANSFKFVVVRNPFERVLSAYINKFVQLPPDREPWKSIAVVIKGVLGLGGEDMNRPLTFRDFVEYICSIPQEKMNDHWHLQARLGMFNELKYDLVVDFHELRGKWSLIKDAIGVRDLPSDVELNFPSTNSAMRSKDYYDSGLADKIYSKFIDDFELLGYERMAF